VLSNLSLFFEIIGTAGLILLSIFDSYRYHTLHDIFLFCFMGGYVVSAIFICWAYQRLGIRKLEKYRLPGTSHFPHLILDQAGVYSYRTRVRNWYVPHHILKLKLYSKFSPLAFAVCLSLSISNAGSVLEWSVAFIFTLYIASFFTDLRPAVHTRNKPFGEETEMQVESNDVRSQRQENQF